MKNYKDYDKQFIGDSDEARLILKSESRLEFLNFGEDGSYWAYFVDEFCEIPDHYTLVHTFSAADTYTTVIFYDDEGKTNSITTKEIRIYRSGDFGCIVQAIK